MEFHGIFNQTILPGSEYTEVLTYYIYKSLVEDLLTVASAHTATLAIHPEKISLDEIFDTIVDTFQPVVTDRGITIIADGHDLHVWADPVRTRQILINLVKNSIMHGNTLTLIEITATQKNNKEISIIVKDNGQGMDKEKTKKISKGQTNTSGYKGWGLGLSIVRMLAEMQGGCFNFQHSGTGVVAELILPQKK